MPIAAPASPTPWDARAIAAAVLPLEVSQLRRPRRDDGLRLALRILVTAREEVTDRADWRPDVSAG